MAKPAGLIFKLESEGVIPFGEFARAVGDFFVLIERVAAATTPAEERLRWGAKVSRGSLQVEAIPISSNPRAPIEAMRAIVNGIDAIESGQERPAGFDDKAVATARDLAGRISDSREFGISRMSIAYEEKSKTLTQKAFTNAKILLEGKADAYGSVEGVLQRLSSRKGVQCVIYDRHFNYAIRCDLPESMMDEIVSLFNQRVLLYGRIRYRDRRPHSVRVEKFRAFPDPSTLPGIYDVKGILGRPNE